MKLPTPFPRGIEEGMREFDRAAALGENREQTSSDRGSTPLASTSGKLPHPISQLAFAGCDIFVPASKDPYRKTVLNKTPENKGFSGAFFFRYTQKYIVHFLIAFENTSSTAFATNFNSPFTSDPWMS